MLSQSIKNPVQAVPVVTPKHKGDGLRQSSMDFQREKGALGLHNWNYQVPQIIVTTAKFMNQDLELSLPNLDLAAIKYKIQASKY